jgi:hypothetical protein
MEAIIMRNRHVQSVSHSTNHANSAAQDLEKRIRQRAYELYLERGQAGGREEEDWLRAEREIVGNTKSWAAVT